MTSTTRRSVLILLLLACSDPANGDPVFPCAMDVEPRCDPTTCASCFEIVPGYSVCAGGMRSAAPETVACNRDPSWPSDFGHECCASSDCPSEEWCLQGVSDANQFPLNVCGAPDECSTQADCGSSMVCVPRIHYERATHCEPAECVTDDDCEPGFSCAPTRRAASGNYAEMFTGVRCVPDPATCTHPPEPDAGGFAGTG